MALGFAGCRRLSFAPLPFHLFLALKPGGRDFHAHPAKRWLRLSDIRQFLDFIFIEERARRTARLVWADELLSVLPRAANAAPSLVPLLENQEDWRLGWAASEALGRFGFRPAQKALEIVANSHWYPPVREAAQLALRHIDKQLSYPTVLEKDFDYKIRSIYQDAFKKYRAYLLSQVVAKMSRICMAGDKVERKPCRQ